MIGGHSSASAAAASDSASISPVTDQTTSGVVAPATRVSTASRLPATGACFHTRPTTNAVPGACLAQVGRGLDPHCAEVLEVHGLPLLPAGSLVPTAGVSTVERHAPGPDQGPHITGRMGRQFGPLSAALCGLGAWTGWEAEHTARKPADPGPFPAQGARLRKEIGEVAALAWMKYQPPAARGQTLIRQPTMQARPRVLLNVTGNTNADPRARVSS